MNAARYVSTAGMRHQNKRRSRTLESPNSRSAGILLYGCGVFCGQILTKIGLAPSCSVSGAFLMIPCGHPMNSAKRMRHSMPNGSGAMGAHGYCAQSSMRCGGAFSEILGGRHCSERLIGEFVAFHPRPWSRPCEMARAASPQLWVCIARGRSLPPRHAVPWGPQTPPAPCLFGGGARRICPCFS